VFRFLRTAAILVTPGQLDGFLIGISGPQPLNYVPIPPCRVADTRAGGGFTAAFGPPSLAAGTERSFPIQSSACGVPAAAQAYSFNVAVVPHSVLGYLTLWPKGQSRPLVATLNSVDGRIKSSGAIISVGGVISAYVTNDSDVGLDIDGYFVPAPASTLAFYPVMPCRMVDTRINLLGVGTERGRGPHAAASVWRLRYASECTSLFAELRACTTGPVGYLTVYPTGTPRPAVATLNDVIGTIAANAAIVPAGLGGSVDVYATNATDLVVENGYFAPPAPGGLAFYNLAPCRVLDTANP
jgi:hypothetical protein